MKRFGKFILLLYIVALIPNIATAKPRVEVIYGKLSPVQLSILKRVFETHALKEFGQFPDIDLNFTYHSTNSKFIDILRNPKTIGVIFLGHPAIDIIEQDETQKIVGGFLQASDARYITKSIFSAAHENMQFISVLTCHGSAVLPHYYKFVRDNIDVYRPKGHQETAENALTEFTSFYMTPKTIDEIISYLPTHLKKFKKNHHQKQCHKPSHLKINYRDLLSSKFDYDILINNTLIGNLSVTRSKRGRKLNKSDRDIVFCAENFSWPLNLTIRPDDRFRYNGPEGDQQQVLDDILIDKLELITDGKKNVLLQTDLYGPIHIGDEQNKPDVQTGLSFKRNWADFENAILYDQLKLEITNEN